MKGESEKADSVVFLGIGSFPGFLAEEQRARLLAKGLVESGCKVTFIMRWWSDEKDPQDRLLGSSGELEGIAYYFACGVSKRPTSWMRRKVLRVKGLVNELLILRSISRSTRLIGAIVSTLRFKNFCYYRVLSLLFSFPLVLNVVELRRATVQTVSIFTRANALLMDYLAPRLAHGLMPISEFLRETCKEVAPNKPLLRVPVVVDIRRCDGLTPNFASTYLLFCGSVGYLEVIEFVLMAYELLMYHGETYLYLVINGPPSQQAKLLKSIRSSRRSRFIKVFSGLTDEELSALYVSAYALLIPLRPTLQDVARFPHKIGEYCASGRPIVSTNYGEVRANFVHGKNVMMAQQYDVNEYARILDGLLDNPSLAAEVGNQGKLLAARLFEYSVHGRRIRSFLESLSQNRGRQLDCSRT